MQAPTPPPLMHMQAAPSLSPSPQQPPPQCLYNQHHLTNPIALQLASPNFSTQTGGEKGALALTISATPPFAHPPPLCRSSHLCGCPHCASQVMCPTAHACPPSLHACQGVQEGQHAYPSPLQPGYAIPPPPSLCTLPCPHAFPLCMHGGGAGGTGEDVHEGRGMNARGRATHKGRERDK